MVRKATDIPLDEFLEFFEAADQEILRKAAAHHYRYELRREATPNSGALFVVLLLAAAANFVAANLYASPHECMLAFNGTDWTCTHWSQEWYR